MTHHLRAITARLRGLFGDRRGDQEFNDEIEAHLRLLTERYVRRGMTEAEAARAARRQFGNVTLLKEAHRDMRGIRLIETLVQDVRYGVRVLGKNYGFTSVAALTLALGIGANTAIFTLVNGLLLRPLPYPEAERLAVIATTVRRERVEVRSTSYPDFVSWRDQNTAFEQIAARISNSFNLLGGNEPERVSGELVSANYFSLLGVRASYGRTFLP
jgi:MacB-like periplasmic core domain